MEWFKVTEERVTETAVQRKSNKEATLFPICTHELFLFDHVKFQPFKWLKCVGSTSNAFPRHHHNDCHSWGLTRCWDICTTSLVTSATVLRCILLWRNKICSNALATTASYKCTRRESLLLNAFRESQTGIRDSCCLHTPMCGFVWMGSKKEEFSRRGYPWVWNIAWPLGCVTMF